MRYPHPHVYIRVRVHLKQDSKTEIKGIFTVVKNTNYILDSNFLRLTFCRFKRRGEGWGVFGIGRKLVNLVQLPLFFISSLISTSSLYPLKGPGQVP